MQEIECSTPSALSIALPPNTQPDLIGRGSFGAVYGFHGQGFACKTVLRADDPLARALRREYNFICSIHRVLDSCKPPSANVFISPRPWAYCNPFTEPAEHAASPVWVNFSQATIAMDRIPALHDDVGATYRRIFFGPAIHDSLVPIRVLRLYLGRTLPRTVEQLAEGHVKSDLLLDIARYQRLSDALGRTYSLPTIESVAFGMGKVLVSLLFGVGIDCRDIELLLAQGTSRAGQCYVVDYNQCRQWLKSHYLQANQYDPLPTSDMYEKDDMATAARRIAIMISGQELYYPRPTVSRPLFDQFVTGYRTEVAALLDRHHSCPDITRQVNQASDTFLAEFEKRDMAKLSRRPRMTLAQLELLAEN